MQPISWLPRARVLRLKLFRVDYGLRGVQPTRWPVNQLISQLLHSRVTTDKDIPFLCGSSRSWLVFFAEGTTA